MAGQIESPFKHLLHSTTGIVFLGTPLRGTAHASATRYIIWIARFLGLKPSDTLTRDLDGNTGVLDDHLSRFSMMVRKLPLLQIRCFYELHTTQVLGFLRNRRISAYFEKLVRVPEHLITP